MNPEAGAWRTILPFYIVNLFILEKHLLFKMLFSETFQILVVHNLPRVCNQKAMAHNSLGSVQVKG